MKERRLFRMSGVAVVLSFIVMVSVACAAAQAESGKSTVAVEPASGAKGAKIKISGAGFSAGEEIEIVLLMGPGQRVGLGTEKVDAITADQAGAFAAESNIPVWAKPGVYEVAVEGEKGSLAKTKIEVVDKK